MKKFNLKLAKEGKPIITRDGRDVNIIYYDRQHTNFPIVALIENRKILSYTLDGKGYIDKDSEIDLFLK